MSRLHLLELHEQPWCPTLLRDSVTELLRLFAEVGGTYRPVLTKLTRATQASGAHRIVDLCAGAGGPWSSLLPHVPESIETVVLTDLYPSRTAIERAAANSSGRIRFHPESVDAANIAPALDGFRTMFTSFHHFRPEQARAILADAVEHDVGIAVFEQTERSLAAVARMVAILPCAALVLTPWVRPWSLGRLFFTYAVPAIPALLALDGVVSCLRTYSPEELRALVQSLDAPHYAWEIGVTRGFWTPVTYLIGHPMRPRGADRE